MELAVFWVKIPALLDRVPCVPTVLAFEMLPLILGCQPVGAAGRLLAIFGSLTAVFVQYLGNQVFDIDHIRFTLTLEGPGRHDNKGFQCVVEPIEEIGRFDLPANGCCRSPKLLAEGPAAIAIAIGSLFFLAVISNTNSKYFLPDVKMS